jgi:hypothetical protein
LVFSFYDVSLRFLSEHPNIDRKSLCLLDSMV